MIEWLIWNIGRHFQHRNAWWEEHCPEVEWPMTGQQFYNRFEQEILKLDWSGHSCGGIALKAARRAANLEK